MTSSLALHAAPGAGFDDPFAMLLACHERVERMLGLLERLADHLRDKGPDAPARQAAADVTRYFDLAGPAHHEDEERHLFPALAAAGEPTMVDLVERLHQEHLAMAERWAAIRCDLQRVAAGAWTAHCVADAAPRWAAFAALYREHIAVEEGRAYPAALALLDKPAQQAMGREMAQRRGVAGAAA